jgi:hypothetical protein
VTPETAAAIKRLEPLCDEFAAALLLDVNYVVDIAVAAARVERLKAARKARRYASDAATV